MANENQTDLHPVLTHYIHWIRAHEKLLVIVLGAWLAFHFYGAGLNAWIDHDKRLATIAQQKVEADANANKQLADELQILKQEFATVLAQTQASIRDREKKNDDQKKQNDNATAAEIAARTTQLLGIKPEEITTSPIEGALVFTSNAAHSNVNALEDGKTAEANLSDTTAILNGCKNVVEKDDQLIAGLNTQLTDEQKSHKADVALEKAKAKRSFLRGFKTGVIVGISGFEAIRVFIFHKP
jgi:hypothetical protein